MQYDTTNTNIKNPSLTTKITTLKKNNELTNITKQHNLKTFTLKNLLKTLTHPKRDPHNDIPSPELHTKQLSIKNLHKKIKLNNTVQNIINFDTFIDINIKKNKLIHISKLTNHFIKNPHKIITIKNHIKITIISIDQKHKHINLSMIN